MNWIHAVLKCISQIADQLERLEHLLVRVGLALWHVGGMLFFSTYSSLRRSPASSNERLASES